jgi:hypothetical protein
VLIELASVSLYDVMSRDRSIGRHGLRVPFHFIQSGHYSNSTDVSIRTSMERTTDDTDSVRAEAALQIWSSRRAVTLRRMPLLISAPLKAYRFA